MRRNILLSIGCLLLWAQVSLLAEYAPVAGGEDFTDLYSPVLLGSGAPITLDAGPQADVLNPSISGLTQRTTLDASYIALTGFGDRALGTGWQGHAVNLGLVSPERVAVVSGSLHVITSALAGMPLGTSVWAHASVAKELYPGWLVGGGLRLGGGYAQQFDMGLSLDLGMLRLGGSFGPFTDVRWGIAVQNIGKWYDPFDTAGAMPSPFTPVAGLSLTAIENEWLRVGASGWLSAPAFSDLRAGLGGEFTFFNTVSLHSGWKIDLRELTDPGIATRSFIPTLAISANFRSGLREDSLAGRHGWRETELSPHVAAGKLYNGVWAFGGGVTAPLGILDTSGPLVAITYPETVSFSPNNDGISDVLSVGLSITDERFVMAWRFEVIDGGGEVVRTIRNKDARPENAGFQSVVDRLLDVRTGVEIPTVLRWDGSTDAGNLAPDGTYSFRVIAEDDNGNVGQSDAFEVVLDTTPPEVTVAAAGDHVLSPNGDGNKDLFHISQAGSVEAQWDGRIVDARGDEVRSYHWSNAAPGDVEWDGRGDDGRRLPDGVYGYRISATDAAGNHTRADVSNIIMNTETTPVSLSITTSFFSPNGDTSMDTITFNPSVPNTAGIERWELRVVDAQRRTVRTFSDTQVAPVSIEFDGYDDSRSVLPEGMYRAILTVRYANGNEPTAKSPPFTVDLTSPTVAVQSDREIFSPNGDGKLDTVTFFQESSRETAWTGLVRTESGSVVRRVTWPVVADQQFTWNGRQDDGRLAPDGRYSYTLRCVDSAGNAAESTPVAVTIDTSDAEIGVRAEFGSFSPNADTVRDRERFFLRVDRAGDVASYAVRVYDSADGLIREFQGRRAVQEWVVWDGTLEDGRRAPDGAYYTRFVVEFSNGIELTARTADFLVDTTPPVVSVAVPYLVFSPDGDGERETIPIVQSSSSEETWVATIRSGAGDVIREFLWSGTVDSLEWDGRDAAGNLAPDGAYEYEVATTDRAGNPARAVVDGIVLDTREPRLFVTSNAAAFSPNGDGVRDSLSLTMYANLLDGAAGWRLTIRSADGLAVREFAGVDLAASRSIEWDGRDGRGVLREGLFTAEFAVDYEKGNRPSSETGTFRVDVSPPDVAIHLSPVPFSPDNDGVNDELTITLDVQDASEVRAWRFEILDRNSRFFNEFSGLGAPATTLSWDGRASDGELVISAEDYPYRFTVTDVLGNTTTREGIIPVDILVIRDGDRLKVQIPSITFSPNSPDLIIDPDDERGAKNRAILERLAQIFEKYSSYSIRIEGHAVNVTGTEREEREELQPLSLERAQAVKDALVELGISERRIAVLGRGGTEPIVPHDDVENRWKNRRVEFILIR